MRGARRILSLVVCSLLPIACGSSGPKSEWPKGNIVLKDANNYTSDTNLDKLPEITTFLDTVTIRLTAAPAGAVAGLSKEKCPVSTRRPP